MKHLITIGLLLLASGVLAGPVEEWVARYNGTGNGGDSGSDLAVDAEGNVYVTGGSKGSGTSYDFTTIKYDSDGNLLWVSRYSASEIGSGSPDALAIDAEGSVYITGESSGAGTSYDYATVKYDSDGNELWVSRYDGPGSWWDFSEALAVDADRNVYVAGWSAGTETHFDYATIKYGHDGNEIWVRRYNGEGNGNEEAKALAVDGEGNVYVTGYSDGTGTSRDYATVKYDPNGNQLWVARYNGPANYRDVAEAIGLDAQCNVYVTGWSFLSSTEWDIATIKYDSSGIELWVARYNGFSYGSHTARALAVDQCGDVFVTGSRYIDSLRTDYTTIKYDTHGQQLWVAGYNGPGDSNDGPYAIVVDSFGAAYVSGGSKGAGTWWDYATVKYDPHGNELWVARYNGPGNDEDVATALALDADGNVYVTGSSLGTGTSYDFATIKYSQLTGIKTDLADGIPYDLSLTCYPNPFNTTTNIIYSLPETGRVTLHVYNLHGQLIETLVVGYYNASRHEILWDASDYTSGVYFYKLTAGDYTETRRVTLLK